MRERYRDGKIHGVVIRTLDRLSRSQTHVAILMEEMEHYGITLHSVKEVIDDAPMGKFARMVLAFVAEMEREKIMDRTVTGKINKALDGKVVSRNKALYGWKWVHNDKGERDHIVLDEDQAAVLRQAGQEYADGVSLRQILKRLEADGIPGPGGGG
jgi:site-specific DNA recombinase